MREWVRVADGVNDSERVGDSDMVMVLLRLSDEERVLSVFVSLMESVLEAETEVEADSDEVLVRVEVSVGVLVSDLDLVDDSVHVIECEAVSLTVSLAVNDSESVAVEVGDLVGVWDRVDDFESVRDVVPVTLLLLLEVVERVSVTVAVRESVREAEKVAEVVFDGVGLRDEVTVRVVVP